METEEPLETGYGPDAPGGDNACNDYMQGLADAYGSLARARGDRILPADDLLLTDGSSPSEFGNVALVRRPLSEAGWTSAAAQMRAFYAEAPGGSFLVFSAWPTPDLTALDFGRIGHPPLMLRPPAPAAVDAVNGLTIRPVNDALAARDWEWVLIHGFPLPELQPLRPGTVLPERALAASNWHHWVGYLDGEPVGCGSAYVGEHHVDVEFIATVEAARGRGIGRALTATAASAAHDRPAMLIASDLGRSVYERLGFRSVLRFTLWAGHRPAQGR